MSDARRSYRCTYTPLDRDGYPVLCDTGVLPFVQVQAADAEEAQRAAFALKGCPITEVQRLEPERMSALPGLALGAALAAGLAACGGGDPEDACPPPSVLVGEVCREPISQRPVTPACAARPELCQ